MIAYEDLVIALKSWRARNGLPTTPPDYGDAGPTYSDAPVEAAPDEIYDLSDDSGLIVAEDLQAQASGEIGGAEPYGDEPSHEMGAIETGVEISAEGGAPVASDYDNPPGTDAYSDSPADTGAEYGQAEPVYEQAPAEGYNDVSTDMYAEQPVDTLDADAEGDDATVVGGDEYADDAHKVAAADKGTLDADPEDVVDEMDVDAAADVEADAVEVGDDYGEPPGDAAEEIDAAGILGEELVSAYHDEPLDDATVVAADPGDDAGEPEPLPPEPLPEPLPDAPDDKDL